MQEESCSGEGERGNQEGMSGKVDIPAWLCR